MAGPTIISLKEGIYLQDRYLLICPLGAGSMAEVWEAQDDVTNQKVAIKVVAELLAPSEQARKRFEREMFAIGRINHPNVVGLLGHGEVADGRPFLVMEHVSGQTLGQYLKQHPVLGARSVLILTEQMLKGLEAAHVQQIVHRDIKPANILLARLPTGKLQVKVLDFGVARVLDFTDVDAKLTRTGTMLGSPRYMAYELARDASSTDPRSDIFSVGAVMYHALTGAPPIQGQGLGQLMMKILNHDIPPLAPQRPDLDARTVACVEYALGKMPEERFASAAHMRQEILAILQTL